jgi:hypothetical protein
LRWSIIFACAVLGACSSGSPPPIVPRNPEFSVDGKLKIDLLFVADNANNTVLIYQRRKERLVRTIRNLRQAQALALDASANLYVSTLNDYGSIEIFAPPYNSITRSLVVQGSLANAVAVAPSGLVVAIQPTQMELVGSGTSEVCTVFGPPSYLHYSGGAFDRDGNLFFDGTDTSGKPIISVWPAVQCNIDPTSYNLSMGSELTSAGSLAIGPDGRLFVLDPAAKILYTYAPPKNKKLGPPIHTTPLTGIADPVAFAFTPSGHGIFVSDGNSGVVQKFMYPSGGSPLRTVQTGGRPSGVAIAPPRSI